MSRASLVFPANWRAATLDAHYEDVKRVISMMHDNLAEELSLQDLADVAVMTPFHFNRVFRHITGVPPCRFLWMLRLEAAKRLLVTTDRNVIHVCYDVGYNSLGTFTRRFTQLVGISPLRFRRMAAEQTVRRVISMSQCASDAHEYHLKQTIPAGTISLPPTFDGFVLICLLPNPVPYEQPLHCTVAVNGGRFEFDPMLNGRFFLFAAGMRKSMDPLDLLLSDRIYRGAAPNEPVVVREGACDRRTGISLCRPKLTDPPILSCLPTLMQRSVPSVAATTYHESF